MKSPKRQFQYLIRRKVHHFALDRIENGAKLRKEDPLFLKALLGACSGTEVVEARRKTRFKLLLGCITFPSWQIN